MFAPHFKDETVGLQKWMLLAGCWPCFWCSFLLWLLILWNLMKNLTLDVFPGRREAPNILHDGKMLAPHYEDEIAGLQKCRFLQFFTFFCAVFFIVTHIYWQTMYILQKNCPQMSYPGRREATNILHPPFEGSPPPKQLRNPSHRSQLGRAIN